MTLYNFNILNFRKSSRKDALNKEVLLKENKIIDQQDHRNIAKLIVDRNNPAESYYLLFGPQGVGKSMLITLAKEAAEKEVFYIDGSDEFKLPRNLSREMKNYVSDTDYINCDKVYQKFEKFAEKKKKKENCTPLLIIDDVKVRGFSNYYNVIRKIQHDARNAAENGNYNVMFVTNDQMTLQFFLDDPAESHMEILYLGDLNEDVALSYLLKHGIDRDTAREIYKAFGGRIINLTHAINYFKRNNESKNFLNDYFDGKSISIINRLDKCVNKKNRSKVFEFLYNHSEQPFSRSEFKIYKNMDHENDENDRIYSSLVENGILTMAKNFKKVTFVSPFTRYVFKNLYEDEFTSIMN
ncbi:hypothetical protein C1645_807586 [Glomus cerebriforme]|uniref:ATPase AAA-type core domain-containing protein n=1 Tax=Glomus cerebriforme TaxID=658196 RepID=A0A397SVV3_9GLOM|nr:hypothetical protein C1645_807586 [Glomus cerebriforme]